MGKYDENTVFFHYLEHCISVLYEMGKGRETRREKANLMNNEYFWSTNMDSFIQ
jgi:hypothetical protein